MTPARPRSRPDRAEAGRRTRSSRPNPAGHAALVEGDPDAPTPASRPRPPGDQPPAPQPRSFGPAEPLAVPLPPLPPRAYGPSAAARASALRRLEHRRRRAAVLAVLLAAAGLVLTDVVRGDLADGRTTPPAPPPARSTTAPDAGPGDANARPAASAGPGKARRPDARPGAAKSRPRRASPVGPPASGQQAVPVPFPVTGPGTFAYAAGRSRVYGDAGRLRRYRVAVERGTDQRAADFARAVDATLADRRGWTASGRLRLRRVPRDQPADFTVFLATPGTSERMCAEGGLRTERFTSCRLPGRVVINLARWWLAVPAYGASLAEYRAYAVNHEVGHELGRGHEACPGVGRPAPVMQQQTLGLRGCVANGWPYLGGRRYAGPPVP